MSEFGQFLAHLEDAYLALYTLPTDRSWRSLLRGPASLDLWLASRILGTEDFAASPWSRRRLRPAEVYPEDRLTVTKISIQSPGWAIFEGVAGPLETLRKFLNDRHERKRDEAWRDATDHENAELENELLRAQAERERIGAIRDYNDLLKEAGLTDDERQRVLWDRLGLPMQRLGRHQDSGLLGGADSEDNEDD